MKTILKLVTVTATGVAALALAGNALAVQKLSLAQTGTSVTVKASQANSDQQPAKLQIYVPSGYTLGTIPRRGRRWARPREWFLPAIRASPCRCRET
jgi:hypothetical protein